MKNQGNRTKGDRIAEHHADNVEHFTKTFAKTHVGVHG